MGTQSLLLQLPVMARAPLAPPGSSRAQARRERGGARACDLSGCDSFTGGGDEVTGPLPADRLLPCAGRPATRRAVS